MNQENDKEKNEMERKPVKKTAVVQCSGECHGAAEGPGEELTGDCTGMMEQYPGGIPECEWGCLGRGSCVAACPLGAISINGGGAAQVDRGKCVCCGICVKSCPKGLIRLTPPEFTIFTACVNQAPGAQTRKSCVKGCIACGICVRNCPSDAIIIENIHGVIDEEICISCGMCATHCPRGTMKDADGMFH